ncbi:MAG TPA: hypothetical protein DDZ40_08975 [Deltaproteobacteria bacterium]|nr:hypothetical protein [Deltaproteobacteria bacterium]
MTDTSLTGNKVIHRWIHDVLSGPEYTIIYIDLDHFKGYNDTYGFSEEKMKQKTAETGRSGYLYERRMQHP